MFVRRSVTTAALVLAGLAPAMAVCPGSDVLIQDSFDTLQPTWGQPKEGMRIADGQLIISPPAGTESWIVDSSGFYDDLDMCITVTTVTGLEETEARAGPIFWYQDVNNFYVFEIAPNGKVSVWRRQRGRWLAQIEWQEAEAANKGDSGINELRITTAASDATFFVNGTEFGKLAGSPPEDGQQIGLFAGSPDAGDAVFSFDSLRVTKP